jgi:hypothetical protein
LWPCQTMDIGSSIIVALWYVCALSPLCVYVFVCVCVFVCACVYRLSHNVNSQHV